MPTENASLLSFLKLVSTSTKLESVDEEKGALLPGGNDPPPNYTDNDKDEETAKQQQPIQPPQQHHHVDQRTETWTWYADLLEKYPLAVKAVTAFFILGLGDAAAQGVEHVRGTTVAFDWIRAVRFGAFGFLGAPWAHYYYYFLDYYFPPTEKPFTFTTAIKLLIDQGLQAPALLAFIISCLALLKATGLAGVEADMRANYLNALIANWILWLPASLMNMAFIKPNYRVLYVNVVFFFWTIILSMLVNTTAAE